MEDVPAPVFSSLETTDNDDFEKNYDVDVTISSTYSNTDIRRTFEYYYSTIHITNTKIENSQAFGSDTTSGSGGAICMSSCTMIASASEFKYCKAVFSGASCSISSDICLDRCKFTSNTAYRYGGAIHYQGSIDLGNYANGNTFLCYSSEFISNVGSELGGGLSFATTSSVYLQDCKIQQNSAAFCGGGIYSCNTIYLKLFNTKVYSNSLTYDSLTKIEGSSFRPVKQGGKKMSNTPTLGIRGGAGICVITDYEVNSRKLVSQFFSQGNCYGGNTAGSKAYSKGQGAGHAILIDGNCRLQSMNDKFSYTGKFDNVVSKTGEASSFPFIMQTVQNPPSCSDMPSAIAASDPTKTSLARLSNNGNYQITSNIVPPSIYTYVATPISKLPATTKVTKKSTAVKNPPWIKQYKTLSMLPTAIKTPFKTVFSTAHKTPFKTVFSTAHKTPFKTPFNTVFSTAHKTPFKTVFSTAHKTPFKTPFNTVFSTAHKTPFKTVFSTVHKTPFKTVFSTAHKTPFKTPFNTAFSTAHDTPFKTPFSTAHKTPFKTVFSTAHKTPIETPFKTAFSTAQKTPFQTVFSSPGVSKYATPFSTRHSTPNSTPFSTAHSTVFSTPHNTPFVTFAPTRSVFPGWYVPPESFEGPSTKTLISTWYETNVATKIVFETNITDEDGKYYVTYTDQETEVISIIAIQTEAYISLQVNSGGEKQKAKFGLPMIIGISAGGAILLILLVALILFFTLKARKEESFESSLEMAEETAYNVHSSQITSVTNDNPLWTTTIEGDREDPFKDDFNEIVNDNFFTIKETGLE
ncbi:polymorphic outer membrane protein, putative [Trichomonas vaginalis G3]|uniref:Polymorphic outer membrane protein, putative n=1 Tax=Trichomonas vaginalis (strain ATCC PRA-98 / G3) TaxID=412133 RepID=A2E127_TRIV3|nr:bifunctional inhibitor/lipid-transfer protein/seed storage 2s albumin superfamily protein family [Trichomonas vaginalis G3]EAY13659.1 polymorphic outer membrane protein, putative [Trichomonas vaginalis G3]KAI5529933.1 bifunctional inhibitor/lipid-transfer protein/seed storage 2s albumin superfamily protein family [Trichomonas vaginalis G3]|eukprot:XP_001325882.1 polymorphic outer membrane protein [Trichomonas vaginalis G3]